MLTLRQASMRDKIDFGTVLVTGGTGSIGRHIVNELLETDSKRIIIFNRDEIKHFLMKGEISDPRVEFFLGDVRNYRQIERVFQSTLSIAFSMLQL